jgi:hypothetical protein
MLGHGPTGVVLLHGLVWATKAIYAVVGWFALVGAANAGVNVAKEKAAGRPADWRIDWRTECKVPAKGQF